tara:strand:- start:744 stop:998 length:255 start_codon:yes stop_codon:yes gene_type:complete
MKKILLILFLAAVFSFQHYAESLADEKKTITPQEFGTAIAETPGKLVNFIGAEVEKTKAYQKETWSKTMKTWPWNKIFTKKESE